MGHRRRTRRAGATASALLSAALLAAGLPAAGTTYAAPDHGARAARTLVTLKMPGCEGCTVQPARWIRGSDHGWEGKPKKVRDGKVRWRIRTARTRGLTFAVLRDPSAAPAAALGAVPLVVAGYRGKAAGSTVTNAYASTARRATPCLAGTTKARWTRKVVARYHRVDDPTGPGTVRVPRYFFKHTQRSTNPYARTFRGTLAAQDVYVCRG
ncbi:hypothetical protein FE697_014930 [Mumia zhuanghuii]|uniref:Peptidase inhibitor family I36 n=2 Tax=Mumia TaxID=1546255 RepID=A0ABW1QRX4_9ACTN|nr:MULTISPECIES: hypothetical protein [Mumia]KAA1422438.1 hypothetical protein FE697_014930 [Mumia zhuanghuii]